MHKRAGAGPWLLVAASISLFMGTAACSGSGSSGPGSTGTATGAGGAGGGGANGTGGTLVSVDECAEGTHDCAAEADCIDTPAFYECACKPGYQGDGKTCADIDECEALLSDCDSNALCTNQPGGFACACPKGFTGDGKACDATYTAVSAGQYHACALRSDKMIWCWGLHTSGQIGTGTNDTLFVRPASAGDASDWTAVTSGANFACGLDASKKISCWGANNAGQLGDSTTTGRNAPTPIAGGIADWIALDAGTSHTCAIREGGAMWCWGANNRGQVGDGTTENRTQPTLVNAGPWIAASAGSEFTCAVRDDHTLWCWGLNANRQLGDGKTTNSAVPVQEKTLAKDWAGVSTGNAFTCGVKQDGTRWCWGVNTFGQGGDGTMTAITEPKVVGADTDWATLEAGDSFACGLRAGGSLWCWGDGTVGQTGQPGAESLAIAPVQVGADMDWTAITGGLRFACGIRKSGQLSCWGSATRAAVGLGYTSDRTEPTPVDEDTTWESVKVQLDDGCAIRSSGDLFCWGRNAYGYLGDGTSVTRVDPAPIGAGKTWSRVALGRSHTCGIASEGGAATLWCWGLDNNGELGNGAGATPQTAPAPVNPTPGNDAPWTELAAGYNHTCAVRGDGTLWCWGRNALGQLGDSTTTARAEPKQVLLMGVTDWVDVAASGEFTCARRASGALFCWGRNDVGQLGLGNNDSPQTSPQQVGGASYSAVEAGANHTCAVTMDGKLWCWGRNANGELGLGYSSSTAVLSPMQVGTDADWVRPALGQGLSTCARKKSGEMYCWGVGSFGQLGLGNLSSFNAPQKVPSLSPWKAVSLGNEHTCGILTNQRLSCWGASYYAQLGDGVPFVSTPTRVVDPK